MTMRTFRHLVLLFGALWCATVVSEAQVCVTDNSEFAWQGSPNTQFYSPFVIGGGCSGFDPANAQAVDLVGSGFFGLKVTFSGLAPLMPEWLFFELAMPNATLVLHHPSIDLDLVTELVPSCVCTAPECVGFAAYLPSQITSNSFVVNFGDVADFDQSWLVSGEWGLNIGSVQGDLAFDVLAVDVQGGPCLGCTVAEACNYNPDAFEDDGSCEFSSCGGCTYSHACNFDPNATVDDGSCLFDAPLVDVSVLTDNYPLETTWVVRDQAGAILAQGGPYPQPNTQYDTTFCLPEGCYALTVFDSYGDGICCGFGDGIYTLSVDNEVLIAGGQFAFDASDEFCLQAALAGCTYPEACNFNPSATDDDGSCDYESCAGCTDPDACNFAPNAAIDSGTCLYACYGCTDAGACNFNPEAILDDNSCEYNSCTPEGLALVDVENPFLDLPYVQDILVPFIATYSGWFDKDQVEISIFNPNPQSLVGGVLTFTGTNGLQAVQPIPVTPETCCSLATAIPLPQGLEAGDIETVELLTVNGTLLDRLGVPGQPLGSLELGGVPRAAEQHQLVRAAWTLRGNGNGEYPAVWEIVEENESPSFESAWNLNATIGVAVDAVTGECHLDSDGDGVCDELELPAECDDVNAPNYSIVAAALFCEDYECIEFYEASCCSTAVESFAPVPGAPGAPLALATSQPAPCGQRASELAFCNYGQRAFVVDESNQIVRILGYGDLENPTATVGGATLEITPPSIGFVPTDVDVWNAFVPDSFICCSTMVAVAWMDTTVLADTGYVGLYDTDGTLLDPLTGYVGTGPDPQGLSFSDDGKWLVVASAGRGQWDATDPNGSVTCIDVSSFTIDTLADGTPAADMSGISSHYVPLTTLTTVGGLDARLDYGGVSASLAQMLEPSDVGITPDSKRALVNCQVNNLVVEINLDVVETGADGVAGAYGFGTRDMASGEGFDGKNDDQALLESPVASVLGWRQPDHVEIIEAGTKTWMLTANEGAPRLNALGEEAITVLNTTGVAGVYNGLEVDPAYGVGATGDPSDNVYVYGSRSFSIWDVTTPGSPPTLMYDSGSDIEAALANLLPDYANSTTALNGTADEASTQRGPEPQGIAFGYLKESPHVVVTLEQMGGAVIFKLENLGSPTVNAIYQAYASHRNFADESGGTCDIGDLGAEGVIWLSKDITGNTLQTGVNEGYDAILVANHETGTVTTYSLESALEIPGCTDSCACNYNANATENDDSCEFTSCVSPGCTYADADNYDASATEDDGTCTFTDDCPADINGSGFVDTSDLLDFLSAFGTGCP